ncbi:MAG: GC-type dockerin domain-anchored protein [Phycisphaerales bacterium]
MRRILAPIACASLLASAALANETGFDEFVPGFLGLSFESGGITFSNNIQFRGEDPLQFAATNSTGTFTGDPAFSPLNTMNSGLFTSGTTAWLVRSHQWLATTGELANHASVELWYNSGADWDGIEVSLEGLVGDAVVVSDSFIHRETTAKYEHARLEIEGTPFERIRFICRGVGPTGDRDGILACFDNVVIEMTACAADFDGDGELTIFDFLAFQNAFDAMDPLADFDGDGELTIFDFLAFQNAFAAGCP